MYFDDNYESMMWGHAGCPKQKQAGLHLFEFMGCNKLQIDEELHLTNTARKKLAKDLAPSLMLQLQLQEDTLFKMVEQIADQVLKKMSENPEDPTIEAIVEAIRNKKASRFDGISSE